MNGTDTDFKINRDADGEGEFYPEGINDGREFTPFESRVYRYLKQHFSYNDRSERSGKLLAFTWSPSDNFNVYKKQTEQYFNVSPQLSGILKYATWYWIIPEFNLRQRIHYHGVIKIIDPIKWGKSTYHKLYREGMLRLKPIDNMIKWTCYCMKELEQNTKLVRGFYYGTELSPFVPRNPIRKELRHLTNKEKAKLSEYNRFIQLLISNK